MSLLISSVNLNWCFLGLPSILPSSPPQPFFITPSQQLVASLQPESESVLALSFMFLYGVTFSFIVLYSGSLGPSVGLHYAWNMCGYVLFAFKSNQVQSKLLCLFFPRRKITIVVFKVGSLGTPVAFFAALFQL